MDKPPTKAKPSAEEEETLDELDARLRQLAQDSFAAFYSDPTEQNLQRAQLLAAISYSPDRRRELANIEGQLANRAAGTHHTFWRDAWVRLVPGLVADCDGDSDTVARELIALLPASLRAKCPNYPTTSDELDTAVAAVVAARNFTPELTKFRNQGPWNPLPLARAVLRGLGMTKEEAKSLVRSDPWASETSSAT
jgi:hypothetical protein